MGRVFVVFLLSNVFTIQQSLTMYSDNSFDCHEPAVGVAPETFSESMKYFMEEECYINQFGYPERQAKDHEEFDYVIVGAGTAGCIVARRLVEHNFKVLLLEAGSAPPVESMIPNMDKAMYMTNYDWQYYTVNNSRTSQALKGGKCYWPRGKMLGGSHQMNLMFYYKGTKYDYKCWEELGNTGWSEDIINKYFKKAESLQCMELLNNDEIRNNYGIDGLQIINTMNFTYRPLINKVLESYQEMEIENQVDLNTANLQGSGIATVTAANGMRTSTYAMYINSIKTKQHLTIINNAYVTKVLIDDNSKAYGVKVIVGKAKKRFYAKFEVILSAGSVNTPHLLMLSGVGDENHLKSKGIKCRVNLPAVGRNLQDHVAVTIPIMTDSIMEDSYKNKQFDVIKYLYNRTGYLAQLSTTDVNAFYSRNKNLDYPEFQSLFGICNIPSDVENIFSVLGYHERIGKSMKLLAKNHSTFLFTTALLHPISRGTISLNSSNPYDYPIIDSNYFGDLRDLDTITEGIEIFIKIVNTKYFRSINAFLPKIDWPSCNDYMVNSSDYWKCIAKNTGTTLYHPVGTSSMGPDPSQFVVDDRLRVHLMKNLRVIDASIMPNITSCNTNGPTIMIAERGSDFIIEDHNEEQDNY